MNFVEVSIQCTPDLAEILIAELSTLPYDTFQESDEGLQAYVEESNFDGSAIQEIIGRYAAIGPASFQTKIIPKVNWNEEWEKNFEPITVGESVYVRATFHEPKHDFPYEIIINPQMSFGTGHHDTTYQMLEMQLSVDHKGKKVIDAGTGTGILAIMANKLGARKVLANDIDDWCVSNSADNFSLNGITDIETRLGDIDVFTGEQTDILLANINKNVLLDELSRYAAILNIDGHLLLSGFYDEDVEDVLACCVQNGLKFESRSVRNNWAAITCVKE